MKRSLALLAVLFALSWTAAFPRALSTAPEITLPDLKGAPFKLAYKGHRLTLVNFWATWCLPCREEMPEIAKLVTQHGPGGFRAVGIALESGEAADVAAFIEKNPALGVNYPMLMGNEEAVAKFGDVMVVPTTYLVDESGKVVKAFFGINPDFRKKVGDEIARHLGGAGVKDEKQSASPQTAPSKKP